MNNVIAAEPQWLRVGVKQLDVGVDRERKALLGYVMAQEGDLLEPNPRGTFDLKALKKVVTLARKAPKGLKSRFTHPSASGDGLGTFLGRVRNVHMDTVTVRRDVGIVALNAVRGDLYFAESAFDTPSGNLADYVMRLAEEDSDAAGSSLVLQWDEELQLGEDGKPDEKLPPLIRPTVLHASDIVDTGAAVDGMFSAELEADGLRDDLIRKGYELLKGFLPGKSRDVVEARLQAWLQRALAVRFGGDIIDDDEDDVDVVIGPDADFLRRRLEDGFLEKSA